ncbi:MAG: NAD(P)/FAD-dependent oxidoreductase [Desulfobacterales bacterium]|jgi:phytoene dehydrogenase-like protein|nr:NAD(P)/FAD-dependent oxidoreductase [Desulfobacterales bacterium]
MPHNEYDAIIIGGGSQGLTLGAYLARSGVKVAILERKHEEGGCFCTRETTAPGFLHNHAQCMEFMDWMPFYYDFNLESLGARTVYPDAQFGIAFSDGRPPIVLHSVAKEENFALSHKSISVYSKQDADNWVACRKRAVALEPLFCQFFYNPPTMPSKENPDPLHTVGMVMMEQMGLPAHLNYGSGRTLVDYLFETPELRTLFYKGLEDWGTSLEMMGMGPIALISLFFIEQNSRLGIGGTHTLAHAMVMAAVNAGADFYENAGVSKIIVEGGKAVGVRLTDGTEMRAGKLVASNADLKQTLLGMVGEENLSPLWVKRTKAFRYGRSCVLGSTHMALHEAPNYKSAKHDPAINKCLIVVTGFDEPQQLIDHVREVEAGKIPTIPGLFCAVNSLFDPTYAPPGKHAMSAWIFFPKASKLTRAEWAEVRATYNDRIIEHFTRWAPNMTRDNVIADFFETPLDLQDDKLIPEGDFCLGAMNPDQMAHNRPFLEAAMYRAEIKNLYLCSSGQHPLGGISCGVGYNAYKVIAEDLGLTYKPWETSGRGY